MSDTYDTFWKWLPYERKAEAAAFVQSSVFQARGEWITHTQALALAMTLHGPDRSVMDMTPAQIDAALEDPF